MSGGSLTINAVDENDRATGSRRGGVRGYWLDEGDAFTKSKPKFRQITLKPHKLGVFYYATEEELSDAAFGYNIESKLAQYAGEEIRWLVNEAVFAGNGVNKPLGVLNAPCTVSVAKETSQTAATINFVNIHKMYVRMLPDCLSRARWYINQDCLSQLFKLAWPDAAGTYPIYMSGSQFPNAAEAPFGTLLGRPVEVTEHNETLGTTGDIVFADMSQYALAVRGGIKSAFSMHVAFTSEQNCWRFSYRVDGQPYMNKVLTPAKGTSNTLAPFVKLDTRA
jgi:HK97 family phage major capsid protein